MDAPNDVLGIGLAALGLVVAGVATGAVIGAAAMPPCKPTDTASSPICGPGWGGLLGGTLGVAGSGAVGLGVAVFAPSWRAVGLTATGIVAALFVAGAAQQALAPKPPSTATG